jgi:hypothetical protein
MIAFPKTSRLEPTLRLIVGLLLWGISASLTLGLLLSLTDRSLFQGIGIGIVAISLEGTKILTWRAGGKARVLAIVLICLSGIASLGAALEQVATASNTFQSTSIEKVRLSPTYRAASSELQSLDSEIASLVDRLGKLPSDYVTASTKLTIELQSLRDRRKGVYVEIDQMEASTGTSPEGIGMVALLAEAAGLKPQALLLILLLVVSGTIEAGALILTANSTATHLVSEKASGASEPPRPSGIPSTDRGRFPWPSYAPPIATKQAPSVSPEDFLRASIEGADLPYLRGRDKTAEMLGISCADAKRAVRYLIEKGEIIVEGKRLRLPDSYSRPHAL